MGGTMEWVSRWDELPRWKNGRVTVMGRPLGWVDYREMGGLL